MSCLSRSGAEVLNAFHERKRLRKRSSGVCRCGGLHSRENRALEGLGESIESASAVGERCADQKIFTWIKMPRYREPQREALYTYEDRAATTDAGGVGRDGCGAGRRISRRECAGADGSVDGGQAAFAAALNGDELLLSGDTACHEKEVLRWRWTRNAKTAGGFIVCGPARDE